MYRVRRSRKKPWRKRWPLKKLWPQKVDQRFCQECGLPFLNGPLPKEIRHFQSGNVATLLLPSGDWRRRRFVVTIGRWKSSSGRFYLSEFVPDEELDDLARVVLDKGGRIHGCDEDAPVETVPIVHDVAHAIAHVPRGLGQPGMDQTDEIRLDLEVDVLGMWAVFRMAR